MLLDLNTAVTLAIVAVMTILSVVALVKTNVR